MNLISLIKLLDCSWFKYIKIESKANCRLHDCHNNALKYVNDYGGERLIGYYIIENNKKIYAVLHSIVKTQSGKLIDITPSEFNFNFRLFGLLNNQTPNYKKSLIILNSLPQEVQISTYLVGDAKMDVTEDSFKGLSL